MNKTDIKHKLEKKINSPGIIEKIVSGLSNSELNSFYLELFKEQSRKISPAGVMRMFKQNRFALPVPIDIIAYKEFEIECLKKAEERGFEPVHLSPLAPFGSCSALGLVSQNNVVSAVRGTEVLSDATNVLALRLACEIKKDERKGIIKYCTTHRHTRAQYFTNPILSAHFGAFCMVSGGFDTGHFNFELDQIAEHFQFYNNYLSEQLPYNFIIRIFYKNESKSFRNNLIKLLDTGNSRFTIVNDSDDKLTDYYQTVRIKIFVNYKDDQFHLVDMGFVDWTQKLLNNKKHRLLTSGFGIDLLYKIKEKLI